MVSLSEKMNTSLLNERSTIIFIGILLISSIVLLVIPSIIGTDDLVFLLTFALAGFFLLALECVSWYVFFVEPRLTPFGITNGIMLGKIFLGTIFLTVLFEVLTLYGSATMTPLVWSHWSLVRMSIFFYLSYAVLFAFVLFLNDKQINAFLDLHSHLGGSLLIRIGLGFLAILGMSALLAFVASDILNLSFDSIFMLAFVLLGCIVLFVSLRRYAGSKPEWFFFIAAVLLGSYIALTPPAVTNISWDDQIHFKRALAVSYLVNSEYSDADITLLNPLIDDTNLGRPYIGDNWVVEEKSWTQAEINAYHKQLNDTHTPDSYHVVDGFSTAPPESSVASYSSIGYIPSALGLWLGRLLNLPFDAIFSLGRWMNLFSYCLVSFFAIRIIPVKKILMCAVALLPTSLFMAANYSYDPWLISFLFLAVALVVREICSPDKILTSRTWAAMLGSFLVALAPKAIYFPIIGLLFLMPKSKFSSSKQRRLFFGTVIALSLVVVATFLLPFMASGGESSSDLRGGSDVSSSGQVGFILSNPIEYMYILKSFLFEQYLTIEGSTGYTTLFAYFGNVSQALPWFTLFPIVLILFVAVTDANAVSQKLCKVSVILWMTFLFIASIVLVATSLYISFTPVGFHTVNGCQPRYLLPLLFSLFALCFNFKIANMMKPVKYNLACISLSCVPMVLCCWFLVAEKIFI